MFLESNLNHLVLGGIMIGLGISLLKLTVGRVFGVSGIIKNLIIKNEKLRSFILIVGIVVGASLMSYFFSHSAANFKMSGLYYVISGLMVGLGASLANGCTSGHCINGVSQFNPRSFLATILFLTFGIITASIFS
ncbi:MAG: YeeE/YedE family protein [Methylophilales bacterium]|nr:YeeE/YedE family protein [Methylophilales bacterium]